MALEVLADQVHGFGVELAAAVECDGLRAERVDDVAEYFTDVTKGRGPVDIAKAIVPAQTQLRMREAVGCMDGGTELGTLGADAAQIRSRAGDADGSVSSIKLILQKQPKIGYIRSDPNNHQAYQDSPSRIPWQKSGV